MLQKLFSCCYSTVIDQKCEGNIASASQDHSPLIIQKQPNDQEIIPKSILKKKEKKPVVAIKMAEDGLARLEQKEETKKASSDILKGNQILGSGLGIELKQGEAPKIQDTKMVSSKVNVNIEEEAGRAPVPKGKNHNSKITSLEKFQIPEDGNEECKQESISSDSDEDKKKEKESPARVNMNMMARRASGFRYFCKMKSEVKRQSSDEGKKKRMKNGYIALKKSNTIDKSKLKLIKKTTNKQEEKEYCLNQNPDNENATIQIHVIRRKQIKSDKKVKFAPKS